MSTKPGNKNKYAADFTITKISDDEYDIIHSAGYAECLRDMIGNLRTLKASITEHDLDPLEYLDKLIETAEETLNEDNSTLQ